MTAETLKQKLHSKAQQTIANTSQRFFKTGPGENGEGDIFIGVTMPELRNVASAFVDTPKEELTPLLNSRIHEERMLALVILTLQFKKAQKINDSKNLKQIFDFCFKNRHALNNWDLVDVTAPIIFGGYLFDRDRRILRQFSGSKNLWERRIAIVSTLYFIRDQDFDETLLIAKNLLNDPHDLIHKATGWMLREIGKKDESVLRDFLNQHATKMPRTMLRYAIERMADKNRKAYLNKK